MKILIIAASLLSRINVTSRLVATNEAPEYGTATNELSLEGEWLQISPYGDFPNKVGLQRIQKPDAEQMVTAFNSLRGKVSRAFMGLPIYVGHPDVQPDKYADKRRYGKITELAAREDGFYGKVAMNSLGKAALEEGHFQFNSPTWLLKREKNFVRPVELISVGLTNTPQIPGDPWAKNETESNNMQWLKDLLVSKGLLKAEDSEDQLKTAVNSLLVLPARVTELEGKLTTATNEQTRLTTDLTAANSKVTNLTTERDNLATARNKVVLDLAVNDGCIKEADRAAWNEKLTASFDTNLVELRKLKAVNTKSKLGGAGDRKDESTQSDNKIVAINSAVRKYAADNNINIATNDGYNQAFAELRKAQPALFA
jgi:hypothetical protein